MKIRKRKQKYIPGDHLIQDDLSGEIIRRSESVKLWNGLITHRRHYEERNPQDFLKARRERPAVREARPRTTDTLDTPITADDL